MPDSVTFAVVQPATQAHILAYVRGCNHSLATVGARYMAAVTFLLCMFIHPKQICMHICRFALARLHATGHALAAIAKHYCNVL